MIQRHSSRQAPLHAFLPDVLHGATGYDRIAGYFRSSMLAVGGEALEEMAPGAEVRIICNAELDSLDVLTARAAQQGMLQEWKQSLPDHIDARYRAQLRRFYDLLVSGRLQVKVLPNSVHGLLHGKAGIVHHADSSRLCFVGSANETVGGWARNYEIVWADRSPAGCDWVQAEFDALWHHPDAHPLAQAVITDIKRVIERVVIPNLAEWRTQPEVADAQAIIEAPIYARENGLWAHQKWFIRHAFELHRQHGARLVLADQVGLGKTVQLALAAKLMLLCGSGNVLVVVPKPLMEQWRDELWDLLGLPSAIWTGREWIDERGLRHPVRVEGHEGLRECPRRLGIVSGGLIKHSPMVRGLLTNQRWECVIIDEAHHARRKNTGQSKKHEAAQPNNLLQFLNDIGPSTRSMLLATATPIQIDPIEAYDLLNALNEGNWHVLGKSQFNKWRMVPRDGLEIVGGLKTKPTGLDEVWPWMRDPFPDPLDVDVEGEPRLKRTRDELAQFWNPQRSPLGNPKQAAEFSLEAINAVKGPDRGKLDRISRAYFDDLNPYIAHIVRRRREYLETAIDPATNEPFLPKVEVELWDRNAIDAPFELREAFVAAEGFCREVGQRPGMNQSFLETLLLRRVGSSVIAGMKTARKMLGTAETDELEASDEGEGQDLDDETEVQSKLHPLSVREKQHLEEFVRQLEQVDEDPKYRLTLDLLRNGAEQIYGPSTEPWLDLGCIVFSQYFDTAQWIAEKLTLEFPDQPIALYAGAGKSGIYESGMFESKPRDVIKGLVRSGDIRLVIGTDAASEGLNLQRLGTLINLDLPWNPTRLEQRKGRIQRIGQVRNTVCVYNMRYRDSVEDKVHQKLSTRLESINNIFGQLPDTLEAIWIDIARNNEARADQLIESLPEERPFIDKYDRIANVDWESCSQVLDAQVQLDALMRSWDGRQMG